MSEQPAAGARAWIAVPAIWGEARITQTSLERLGYHVREIREIGGPFWALALSAGPMPTGWYEFPPL